MSVKDTNPKDAIGSRKWRNILAIPKQVLWELGLAMFEGGVKYGRHNYRVAGVRASVYLDAAYGHLFQWEEGEDIDGDSGLSHVTKAIASLVVLRDAMMNDFFVDDRPPKVKDLPALRERLQGVMDDIVERHPEPVAPYTEESNPAPYREDEADRLIEEWEDNYNAWKKTAKINPSEEKVVARVQDEVVVEAPTPPWLKQPDRT